MLGCRLSRKRQFFSWHTDFFHWMVFFRSKNRNGWILWQWCFPEHLEMKGYFLVSSFFLLFPAYATLLLCFLSLLFHFLIVIFLTCYPLASFRLLNVFSLLLNFLLSVSVQRMWKQEAITLTTVPAEFKGPKDRSQCNDKAVAWKLKECVVRDLKLPPRCRGDLRSSGK